MTERNLSPAYSVLRASARRVLRLVEDEIKRQGRRATIFCDQLEHTGSRRVYVPAMNELHRLGFFDITRHPKKYICVLSERWRDIETPKKAMIVSGVARAQPMPLVMTAPPQPSLTSTHAT